MRFRFIGNQGEHKSQRKTSVAVFGYKFSEGETVDVKNPEHIAKLKGNSEFEAVDGDNQLTDAEKAVMASKINTPSIAKKALEGEFNSPMPDPVDTMPKQKAKLGRPKSVVADKPIDEDDET